ncbi:hypothetical protein GCM10020255_017910 [Rhodococcus baikonurensis]
MSLTRDLAQQWGTRKGIRVNAIAPGFFKSEMTDQYNDGYLDAMAPRLILGRMGDPEELAATMVWLASEAGGYVTDRPSPSTEESPSPDADAEKSPALPYK